MSDRPIVGGGGPATPDGATGSLPYGLGRLDGRWPPKNLVVRYRAIVSALGEMDHGQGEWPEKLGKVLGDVAEAELDALAPQSDSQFRQSLRELSALSSMVMHLTAARPAEGRAPRNERRTRTAYTSYPTSPRIGATISRFAWDVLDRLEAPQDRPVRIHDPTMEGAPLLLEMAFAAARRERRCPTSDGSRRSGALAAILSGTDQNPVAAPFVRALFDRARARFDLNSLLLDARTADAWETLEATGALQAFVNNPPWGATTDGANDRPLAELGPFSGYRDPYIAYVATGLRKLQPGGAFGFVVPFQVLTAASAAKLRQELLDNAELDVICHLPRSAFPRLTLRTVMILGRRARNGERRPAFWVVHYPMTRRMDDASEPTPARLETKALQLAGPRPWVVAARSEPEPAFGPSVRRLGELATVIPGIQPYGLGRGRPRQTAADLEAHPYTADSPGPGWTGVVRGRNLRKFRILAHSEYLRIGPWLASHRRYEAWLDSPRVLVREICARNGELVASPAPAGVAARQGVLTIICRGIAPAVLSAILNSSLAAHHVRTQCAGFYKESFGRITVDDLRSVPIPAILLEGAGGREGRRVRERLERAVARAAAAALRRDGRAERRAMADIDKIVDWAYAD